MLTCGEMLVKRWKNWSAQDRQLVQICQVVLTIGMDR